MLKKRNSFFLLSETLHYYISPTMGKKIRKEKNLAGVSCVQLHPQTAWGSEAA